MSKKNFLILLADDDIDDSELFTDIVKKVSNNITVKSVSNGKELMSYLENENNALPDLLFLDLNMPVKDGFECLREIKTNDKLKGIQTVIFTTSNRYADIEKTYKAGGDIFISKPDNYKDLFEVFKEQLS